MFYLVQNGKYTVHKLAPLSDTKWNYIKTEIGKEPLAKDPDGVKSEAGSVDDVTTTLHSENGVVVDAFREMRGKLYMGQVCHFILHASLPFWFDALTL